MEVYVNGVTISPLSRGNSLKLSWINPKSPDFKEVAVHRRVDEFGYDPFSTSSVEVYRGTAEIIYDYRLRPFEYTSGYEDPAPPLAAVDIGHLPEYTALHHLDQLRWLQGETPYYYTIYTIDKEGNYFASELTSVCGIPTTRYGLGEVLYNELPLLYRRADDEQNYALKKFMSIIGEQLDHVFSLIKINTKKGGSLNAHPNNLELAAKSIGWVLDKSLPISTQRRSLRVAGNFYRYAGTKLGLDALVKYYSGFPTTSGVTEGFARIFRTVNFGFHFQSSILNLNNTTVDFRVGGTDFSLVGTANDPLFYLWDFRPNAQTSPDMFTAYIEKTIPLTVEDEIAMINRVRRALDEFTPIGVSYTIQVY